MAEGWLEVRIRLGAGDELLLAAGVLQEALVEMGYEGFVTEDAEVLLCYVRRDKYSVESLQSMLDAFEADAAVDAQELPIKNWNEEWERNVTPVVLRGSCDSIRIRAAFHSPEEGDVIVTPRMAFGTGHHATTSLVGEVLIDADLRGKRVLDMGCGTGILALVAVRRGAVEVDAIDYDEDAVRNARENVKINRAEGCVNVIHGGFDAIPKGVQYDCIASNLTLNLLMAHMSLLATHLRRGGGRLVVSGFLTRDVKELLECARRYGLREIACRERGEWACCVLGKEEC